MTRTHRTIRIPLALGLAVGLAGCSGSGAGDSDDPDTVTLVTHDSFVMSPRLEQRFEDESGYALEVVAPGDAGALVNQLVLTAESPLGDVVYGLDNTFGSRAVDEGVLAAYTSPAATDDVEALSLDGSDQVTAIDFSDVCLNVDRTWFADNDVAPPTSFDDLLEPAYADLTVVTDPAASSPGLAMLLATVDAYGDGWTDYWAALRDNGVLVDQSWADAYNVDFTASGGERPIVLSYASSPPFTVPEGGGEPTTEAVLDTCYRQVEYAGVLDGAANPDGAEALVDFMLGDAFQRALPTAMYVYPARGDVALPPAWQRYAPLADEPAELAPAEVDANRDAWIEEWTTIVIG